jgi:hypothetical protein
LKAIQKTALPTTKSLSSTEKRTLACPSRRYACKTGTAIDGICRERETAFRKTGSARHSADDLTSETISAAVLLVRCIRSALFRKRTIVIRVLGIGCEGCIEKTSNGAERVIFTRIDTAVVILVGRPLDGQRPALCLSGNLVGEPERKRIGDTAPKSVDAASNAIARIGQLTGASVGRARHNAANVLLERRLIAKRLRNLRDGRILLVGRELLKAIVHRHPMTGDI